MKRVLITGANSYIGEAFRKSLLREPHQYAVDVKDTVGWKPGPRQFVPYDVVFHVAGIAHMKETRTNQQLYYDINRDLAIQTAKAAKAGGTRQFILLSSMSVYGMTVGSIGKDTPVNPVNAYGKSKVEADEEIKKLEDKSFLFACLRPPMVYGRNCKGNYQQLRRIALTFPVFPKCENSRSMLYIENLCKFVKDCIDEERNGLFFPQNAEYTNTSDMVRLIAENNGKKIKLTTAFNWAIAFERPSVVKKVFGSLTYELVDTVADYGLAESIRRTESRGVSG